MYRLFPLLAPPAGGLLSIVCCSEALAALSLLLYFLKNILTWLALEFLRRWKGRKKVKSLSHVWLFVTPWIVAYQACLSMGFSRQEYQIGLSFPSPRICPIQGLILGLLQCRQTLYPLSHQGSPNSILKSIDITLPTKVHLVKGLVFPVVMYGCERWIIKKAECWKTDVFELWCWKRLLRVPWTARTSNQSILKEINPEYSLEGPMLKVKL